MLGAGLFRERLRSRASVCESPSCFGQEVFPVAEQTRSYAAGSILDLRPQAFDKSTCHTDYDKGVKLTPAAAAALSS